MPGVIAVFTAADLGPAAGAGAVQPDGRPHAAGHRQGPLRRRDRRRRRHRDTSPRAQDAVDAVIVDIDLARGRRRPRSARWRRARCSTKAPGRNVVFDTTALGMPENSPATGTSPTARSSSTGRFMNQRVAPCPHGGAGLGRRLGRRSAPPVGQHAARPGREGRRRRGQPGRRCRRAHHHPRRRWRLRRQDRRLPRGTAARPDRQEASAGRCAGARPAARSWSALGHGRAQLQYVTIGGTRDGQGHPLPAARHPGLRRASPTWAPSSPRS